MTWPGGKRFGTRVSSRFFLFCKSQVSGPISRRQKLNDRLERFFFFFEAKFGGHIRGTKKILRFVNYLSILI